MNPLLRPLPKPASRTTVFATDPLRRADTDLAENWPAGRSAPRGNWRLRGCWHRADTSSRSHRHQEARMPRREDLGAHPAGTLWRRLQMAERTRPGRVNRQSAVSQHVRHEHVGPGRCFSPPPTPSSPLPRRSLRTQHHVHRDLGLSVSGHPVLAQLGIGFGPYGRRARRFLTAQLRTEADFAAIAWQRARDPAPSNSQSRTSSAGTNSPRQGQTTERRTPPLQESTPNSASPACYLPAASAPSTTFTGASPASSNEICFSISRTIRGNIAELAPPT